LEQADEILEFWFGKLEQPTDFPVEKSGLWFRKSEFIDQKIRDRFLALWEKASKGDCDDWAKTSRGRLALIILLDQFSRNMFRDDPKCFSQDEKSLKLATEGLERKMTRDLFPVEKVFFYMPLEHAENREAQARSVRLFSDLVEDVEPQMKSAMREFLRYAEAHKKIIDRFGRFPHRNKILGRETTPEEKIFLLEPGSSF
jgi:uncharacterized protein (DUF924 family)